MQPTGKFSLYFHVPFCARKCDYCHFFVVPDHERYHAPYLTALRKEWELRRKKGALVSIYFGGGTPSRLGPAALGEILSWTSPKDIEITLEANPDHLTPGLLQEYRDVGINRLSIGVQSFDDRLLHHLSRTHSADEAAAAVQLANEAGFDNISIDLMYDLPHQSLSQWEATLKRATSLPIAHVSLYNLTIEPHTVFFKKRATLPLPDQETSLAMLEMAVDRLEEAGLKRYEISAFGRPSQHNMGYWTNRPFIGLGPSAFSHLDGRRFRNVANFWRYVKALDRGEDPMDFEEKLDDEAREKERVAVGLRVLEGVETALDLQELVEAGWLIQEEKQYRLSNQGLLFYDTVASEIVG